MRLNRNVVGVAAALLSTTVSISAHHAFSAEFDAKKPISLEGSVTKVEWINPHSWIHMEVTSANGKAEEWMIEMGSVGTLVRRGFTKNILPTGSKIEISGYRAKDGSRRANGRDATFADGRSFLLGSSGTGAPYDKQ
jgi:hypothetical protein